MSPLQLQILLCYYVNAGDYRDGDFSMPAVREAIDDFRDRDEMIEADPEAHGRRCYRLTKHGRVFVAHLLSQPLPVQCWKMPSDYAAAAVK